MQTISELKEQAVTQTPLLLLDCVLADGRAEHWSTHAVQASGTEYQARVLRHNVFEIQTASDQGVDGIPRISLALANADSYFSQIERSVGLKGARLTARFLFYDLKNGEPASESQVLFLGTCQAPEEITESVFRVSASNRMSLQRLLLPQVRIQRRCPWNFPGTEGERVEAVDGGAEGKYSRFYRCGYSAGAAGGAGEMDGSEPYPSCGYTRADCEARGMLSHFGGFEYVPSTIQVRTFGESGWHASAVIPNEARYNDFVPMVYGTAWFTPPVVLARNDGNLTHMEVLLGIGEIQGVVKVLVNDVEIPLGRKGANMTGTGWYNVPTLGTRQGGFNLDFVDGEGSPAGDPYGSMAYLSLVVPNRINNGKSTPQVKVLLEGLKVPVYLEGGDYVGEQWSNNPAWVLLDVLRRSGWKAEEIEVASFARVAAHCDEAVTAKDPNGNEVTVARFQCNLAIQKRRSAADVVRGIRNGSRLYLTYGSGGRLELRVEGTLALQQPAKPQGSNSTAALDGGWPAYEFGDGTMGRSGILRRSNGEPAIRLWSRSSSDAPNRFAVEFQDALNEYQQDSLSLTDAEDVAKAGQETTGSAGVLGLPNFDQGMRILRCQLEKSVRGNLYVEFSTSVKAVGLRPGDLITLTYGKEGFERQLFRVLKIAPGQNCGVATVTAQIHRDEWYAAGGGDVNGSGRREGRTGAGLPRPIVGTVVDEHGDVQFGIEESEPDGGASVLEVSFTAPRRVSSAGPGAPLLSLAATIGNAGTLAGGQTLYYAVAGVSADGTEGALSFTVRATLPEGSGRSVTLKGLSFARATAKFQVYRGRTPAQLYRIASDQTLAAEFTDAGASSQLAAPPDADFDHANFYWRMELQPAAAATTHTTTSVGNDSLQMTENAYRGTIVRITRGAGAGQERAVLSNTGQVLTVTPAWDATPDAGSFFVVAEAGWRFGAVSATSPVKFDVPNREGQTVQICGRSANANDVECATEISTVTRWDLGGAGGDTDVPPAPVFGLSSGVRGGTVEIGAIGFEDLANTRTISSGTLRLFYWNELTGQTTFTLATAVDAAETVVTMNEAGAASAGDLVQVDGEVMRVEERIGSGTQYRVTRGAMGTPASTHGASAGLYHLEGKTVILPFPEDFFGTPYCGSWMYPVVLPDVRLACAELFVTNRVGNSPVRAVAVTQQTNHGLRTLSGGQYTIQVDGFLAVDQVAAPPLVVEATHPVRDVYAVVGRAADAPIELRLHVDGQSYCTLTINAGSLSSASAEGFTLPLLNAGSRVTLAVLSVGQTVPGSDLTVIIRL
jgi:hypothetical protein